MTKKTIDKREIGERVDVLCNFEPTTVKDLGDGVFEAIITTSEVDRTNENIETEGIDTTAWAEKNPVVLYGHDYEGLPIGKGLSLTTFKNKLKSRFQLAIEEYPFAKTVAAMIKGGYLNSVSIGGVVREWSEDYRTIKQMEMVEFSVVPVPANASAIITARALEDATGKSLKEVKDEYQDFARKVLLDKVSDLGDDEINQAIKVLENLVATLKESAKANSTARDDKPEVRRIKHITLRDSAKAVATQSQRIIKTVKLKSKDKNDA